MGKTAYLIMLVMAGCLPGAWLRLSGTHLDTVTDTSLYGLAIICAAFLLSWAAEAAEVDISQGLAVAFIAFIAVLPEYAVDITFAWKAGNDPEFAQYAVANMTGGNRLLIGAAWPLVFLLFWWRTRRTVLQLEHGHAIEVVALTVATLYSFSIPLKGEIALYDSVVLAAIFVAYVWVIARVPSEEPELVGPALAIGTLPKMQRRGVIAGLFVFAALAILACAEPFAEGLVHSGTQLGIDEFLLVQWLAPFASEAPEFLVAALLAWRGRATVGMGALISSKVNQWTLLIGGLPVAYALSSQSWNGLPLDTRQVEEVFLTAAQSAFAVAIIISLTLGRWEVIGLFALFALQFAVPVEQIRMAIGVLYIVIAAVLIYRDRRDLKTVWTLARRQARGDYSEPELAEPSAAGS